MPFGTAILDHATALLVERFIFAPIGTADVMSMPIQPLITNIAKIEAVRGDRFGVSRLSWGDDNLPTGEFSEAHDRGLRTLESGPMPAQLGLLEGSTTSRRVPI